MAEDLSKKLYVSNAVSWKDKLSKKRFSDRKLDVKVIERGIILPMRHVPGTYEGGVCDNDFNFVSGFFRKQPPNKTMGAAAWCAVESGYIVGRKELVQLDEDVIFGGALIGHIGHFFAECFSRMWYVLQNSDSKSKIAFIINSEVCKTWAETFFKSMGIEMKRVIYVQKPMQFRSVTVPDQSQYSWDDFTKEHVIPYQAIKSNVKPGKVKKVYLTRSNYDLTRVNPKGGGAWCFNEKYFEDFFAARGFEVIAPEKLSIKEQISLMVGADEIAATIGTLTHWVVFCKPSVKLIILNRTKFSVSAQALINEAFGIKNYFIVETFKKFMWAEQHNKCLHFLGATKYWKKFVADYFGEQIEEDDDYEYIDEYLDEYINFWCQRYSDPKDLEKWVSSLRYLCNRVVELENDVIQLNKNRPLITYQTHAHRIGWSDWIRENQISNPLDQKRDIQAIKINFSEPFHNVYYSVYYNEKEGWSEEVTNSKMAGTTGKSKAIFGIKIRLDAEGTKKFDIFYRAHKFDGEWTAWAKNGAELLSDGQKLNAIQIGLKNKT